MVRRRGVVSLSLDLDDKWSYLKTHGEPGWESFPSFLPVLVPRVLDILSELDLTITFFVVGEDAGRPANADLLRAIADAGHEIANHSHRHEQWLNLYSRDEIEEEIARAEASIEAATGVRPQGFRGPGFSLSADTLDVLAARGYRYDATTWPTSVGPLARAYFFRSAKLSAEEKRRLSRLFGTVRESLRPNAPYRWEVDSGELIEIPVSVLPGLRLPFHMSYILYIASISPGLSRVYWRLGLMLDRWLRKEPSFLLHPLDFLGCDDTDGLSFFPGMRRPAREKVSAVVRMLRELSARYRIVTLREHAQRVDNSPERRQVRPRF